MQTKDLLLHDCTDRQVVEEVRQVLPNVCTSILAQALVVEAVNLRDLPTLMITSENRNAVFESDF
jgi:hypothetical protein